jgi:antitoxin HigA-1
MQIKIMPTTYQKLEMFNPPHIGEVITDFYLEGYGLTVTQLAEILGVNRTHMSRLINGKENLSVAMAIRLNIAFGSSIELLLNLQRSYDVWQVKHTMNFEKVKVFHHPKENIEMIQG